jgi:hypothetical protein
MILKLILEALGFRLWESFSQNRIQWRVLGEGSTEHLDCITGITSCTIISFWGTPATWNYLFVPKRENAASIKWYFRVWTCNYKVNCLERLSHRKVHKDLKEDCPVKLIKLSVPTCTAGLNTKHYAVFTQCDILSFLTIITINDDYTALPLEIEISGYNMYYLLSHTNKVCFMWFQQQTAIVPLNSANRLVFLAKR